MRNLYVAITQKRSDGKMFSSVMKVSESINLASLFKDIPDLSSANVWPKNVAERSVAAWNEIAKKEDRFYIPGMED